MGQLHAAKIGVGAITADSFADGSISGVKITTGTIPLDRLDGNALNGKQDTLTAGDNISIIGTTISANVSSDVADGSITNAKLALNAVQANNIAAASVTSGKLSSVTDTDGAAVDYTKLTDNAVIERTIASNAITTTKIADNAITTAKITSGNVTSDKLATASVTVGKIAPGAVNISNILTDGVISTAKLADESITSAKMNKNVVDSFLTAGSNVTLTKDTNTGIVTVASSGGGGGGGTVSDGDITTAKLADGAVTSVKLEKNVVDSYITAGSNVTLTKDTGTGVVTISSSGGGGGGSSGTINAVQSFYSIDPSSNVVDPANNNIGVGYNALTNLTDPLTNGWNSAFGHSALSTLSVGTRNTAVGQNALATSNGHFNTAVGQDALSSRTSGSFNTAVGAMTSKFATGTSRGTYVGNYAGHRNTGGYNSFIGSDSGYGTGSMSYSCVFGTYACYSGSPAPGHLCAFGSNSLKMNSSGHYLSAFGYNSGHNNTTGSYNTYLGYMSDTPSQTVNYSYSTAIGANSSITADNQITIGTSTEYVLIPSTQTNGLDVTTDVIANAFTVRSDIRIKKNINDINDDTALHQLRLLKPKTYQYIDTSNTSSTVIGFLAQDVEKVIPYATGKTTNFLPSIYETCTIIETNKLQLNTKTTTDISLNLIDASGNPYTILKVSNEKNEFYINVVDIQDDKTLIINSDISNNYIYKDVNNTNLILENDIYKRHVFTNQTDASGDIIKTNLLDASGNPVLEEYTGIVTTLIFVYGHKVTDFHTIKNDSIFTIAAAASQELDRQLQEAKLVITSLQTNVDDLKSQLITKDQQITSIEQRLSTLENP